MQRALTIFMLLPAALCLSLPAFAQKKFDCMDLLLKPVVDFTYSDTPTADFEFRDSLARTEMDPSKWGDCGSYGPCPSPYPKVEFPPGTNVAEWSRIRVIEAAKKLIGVPYGHYHIPEMGGIDCSNLVALVYNYALGLRFTSSVQRQADEVGRRLEPGESLLPGDIIFLYDNDYKRINHSVIYVDPTEVIDSIDTGVRSRSNSGWYHSHLAYVRRVIE